MQFQSQKVRGQGHELKSSSVNEWLVIQKWKVAASSRLVKMFPQFMQQYSVRPKGHRSSSRDLTSLRTNWTQLDNGFRTISDTILAIRGPKWDTTSSSLFRLNTSHLFKDRSFVWIWFVWQRCTVTIRYDIEYLTCSKSWQIASLVYHMEWTKM